MKLLALMVMAACSVGRVPSSVKLVSPCTELVTLLSWSVPWSATLMLGTLKCGRIVLARMISFSDSMSLVLLLKQTKELAFLYCFCAVLFLRKYTEDLCEPCSIVSLYVCLSVRMSVC